MLNECVITENMPCRISRDWVTLCVQKQFIMPFLYRVTDSISLRPPSARIHIIIYEHGDFVSVLAFRPHVNRVILSATESESEKSERFHFLLRLRLWLRRLRSSEKQIVGVARKQMWMNCKPLTMHVPTLCDWFSSCASACDSDSLVLTWSDKRRSRKRNQNAV